MRVCMKSRGTTCAVLSLRCSSRRCFTLDIVIQPMWLMLPSFFCMLGRPGYCGDRFYRAFAGGQYCEKFDERRGTR